jgi:hypothetical protein
MDAPNEFVAAFAWVDEGSTNVDSGWLQITVAPIVVGTTNIVFTQFSGAGMITVSFPLQKTGSNIALNIDAAGGLFSNGSNNLAIKLDPAGVNLNLSASGTRLSQSSLTAQMIVTDGSKNAQYVTPSGDWTISTAGVATISNGAISDAKVASAANIAVSKLAAGTSGQILLNNATPTPTWTTVSGDVTISATGVTTVNNTGGTGFMKKQDLHKDVFTGNGSTTLFTTSVAPVSNTQTLVHYNGILQALTDDYTQTGSAVTFNTAPETGAHIVIVYVSN